MKISVCIKQVPDVTAYMEIDPFTGEIDRDDIAYVLNPYDVVAVEEALRIKDEMPDSEISALSLGPKRVKAALRSCLAMGDIDRAIHLRDNAFEGLDKYAMSLVLTRAIESSGYDIILCGRQSIDDNDGQIGAHISEFLGIPMVSDISKLDVLAGGKKAVVQRMLAYGDREIVDCRLPAVFTVSMALNTPRYPSFPHSLNALRQEIVELNSDSLDLRRELAFDTKRVVTREISFPKPRPRNIVLPNSDLPVHERLDFLMSGGISNKGCQFLEGNRETVASKLVEIFNKNGIL